MLGGADKLIWRQQSKETEPLLDVDYGSYGYESLRLELALECHISCRTE